MNKYPFVSIIVPCRNEGNFIENCLDSLVAQTYPADRFEILIVDGMSQDDTREVAYRYSEKHKAVRVIDNVNRYTPYAFNLGVRNARGELIAIVGSHSVYESDYIAKCVKYSLEYDADNVGGIIMTHPRGGGIVGKAITISLSNRFGVGNSSFRTGVNEPKWVDTVFGGCYKREVFDKIGLFNENLISSQDIEFNARLRLYGGKILLAPDIVSHYYTRSSILSFLKNNFRNGVWAVLPLVYTTVVPISLRHIVPLLFVLNVALLPIAANYFKPLSYLWISTVAAYLSVNGIVSFRIARREKNVVLLFLMPITFGLLHLSYGIGSIWGGIKAGVIYAMKGLRIRGTYGLENS